VSLACSAAAAAAAVMVDTRPSVEVGSVAAACPAPAAFVAATRSASSFDVAAATFYNGNIKG